MLHTQVSGICYMHMYMSHICVYSIHIHSIYIVIYIYILQYICYVYVYYIHARYICRYICRYAIYICIYKLQYIYHKTSLNRPVPGPTSSGPFREVIGLGS